MKRMHVYRSKASIIVAKISEGEELVNALKKLAGEHDIKLGMVSGIGGFEKARIGLFQGDGYEELVVEALPGHVLEVASLSGNLVTGSDGEVYPHVHVVVARRQNEVYAGHLIEGVAKPFIELFIIEQVENIEKAREFFKHRWSKT